MYFVPQNLATGLEQNSLGAITGHTSQHLKLTNNHKLWNAGSWCEWLASTTAASKRQYTDAGRVVQSSLGWYSRVTEDRTRRWIPLSLFCSDKSRTFKHR